MQQQRALVHLRGQPVLPHAVVAHAELHGRNVIIQLRPHESAALRRSAQHRRAIPKGRRLPRALLHLQIAQRAERLRPRRAQRQRGQQRLPRLRAPSQPLQAFRALNICVDAVFNPPVRHGQKLRERPFGHPRIAPIHPFPRVIIAVPRGHPPPARHPLFIDIQIAPALRRLIAPLVANHDILVEHVARYAHRLMHHAGEDEARVPAHDPLPLIDQRRPPVLPDPRVIRRHHRVHIGSQAVFERHQLLLFAALHHIIRVQPEDKRLCRVVEGRVARGGKIVVPRVIIDAVCKLPGHALGAVRRARVHDDDFIDRALHAAQASREPFLFVFNDHAKRKFRHGAPFRPRSGAHRAALSHRVCRETKKHAPPFP